MVGIARTARTIKHEHYAHIAANIADPNGVTMAFAAIEKRHGHVDILINNAAVATERYAMLLSASDAEAMVATNLLGTFWVSRAAAKVMCRAHYGRIVNIGSIHARLTPPGTSIYSATKAAVETMGVVLSRELAGFGVTVNTLALSPIDTDMMRATGSPEAIKKAVAAQPLDRLAVPADLFSSVDYFCAPESGFVTGQTIYLGGVR